MVSLVNSHSSATSQRWHLWEIDLIFAPGLPPGWKGQTQEAGGGGCAKQSEDTGEDKFERGDDRIGFNKNYEEE